MAVIAGVCRWLSIKDINQKIAARSVLEQALIVGAVFALIFAASLLAAQFGWPGMLGFWLVLVILVN